MSSIHGLEKVAQLEAFERLLAKRAGRVRALARGFYLYALVVATLFALVGFFIIPTLISLVGEKMSAQVVCVSLPVCIFCFLTALIIMLSIMPRPSRVAKPGLKLILDSNPELVAVIRSVAEVIGQSPPTEVYVKLDVNAGLVETGGFFGFGKRRALLLGLPLFPLLTVSQLEMVVAHGLGHYYGGDTRLHPWLPRAFTAFGHIVRILEDVKFAAWIHAIFFDYAETVLDKLGHLMRDREYLADLVATRVAGPKTAIETLKLMFVGDDAFDAYWQSNVTPLLRFGVRPPILDGFRRYLARHEKAGVVARKADAKMSEGKFQEFRVHPTLSERILALEQLEASDNAAMPVDARSALSLLGDLERVEIALLASQFGLQTVARLKEVLWENILLGAYVPMWRAVVEDFSGGLQGVTPDALPGIARNMSGFGMKLLRASNRGTEYGSATSAPGIAIGSALALALFRADWEIRIQPGEPVSASLDADKIEPFEVLGRLASNSMSTERWLELCESAGIADLDMGRVV